jgi:hypothetical protein
MKSPRLFKSSILAALALAGLSVCKADVVYQDTFARVGYLTNSAPTVDNSGNGVTWSGNDKYTTDGTNCVIPSDWTYSWPAIGLPIDMGYFWDTTLSCDVKLDNPSTDDWVGIGYGPVGGYWNIALYMTIAGNGKVNAYVGPPWGITMQLVTNAPAGIVGGWNTIAITYSNYAATADIIVNGVYLAQGVSVPLSGAGGVNLIQYNQGGAKIANFTVTTPSDVVIKPKVESQPVGKQVFVGSPVMLSVRASGTLPLAYQWRHNGSDISDATLANLTIPAATQSTNGSYTVVITNQAGATTSDVATVTAFLEYDKTLAELNFDGIAPAGWYDYGYIYSSTNVPLSYYMTNLPTGGTSGSAAGACEADGTGFLGVQVDWAGFAGSFYLPASISTTYLPAYKYSFDARVENLVPDTVTNTGCRMMFSFKGDDGTNNNLTVLTGTRTITLSSNFQHFSFTLDTSDYGGAAGYANFLDKFKWIKAVQLEYSADGFAKDFVNGPGDSVIVDNLQVVQRTSPPISVTKNSSGQPVVEWVDSATSLQGATNVAGPYIDIPGATSPYPVPAGKNIQFFRTRW